MKRSTIVTIAFFIFCLIFIPAKSFTLSKLVIQPIHVVNGNLSELTFESELDKIWSQAAIDIEFLDFTTYNASGYQFITSQSELDSFFTVAGGKSSDPQAINLWFCDYLGISGMEIAGYTNGIGSNEILISSSSVIGGSLFGIIAHEIGHSLGLDHYDDPYGFFGTPFTDSYNLMSTVYGAPYGITSDDIYPDGDGYFRLTSGQILTAQSSPYLKDFTPVPEPATIILFGSGLLGLAGFKRKSKS